MKAKKYTVGQIAEWYFVNEQMYNELVLEYHVALKLEKRGLQDVDEVIELGVEAWVEYYLFMDIAELKLDLSPLKEMTY